MTPQPSGNPGQFPHPYTPPDAARAIARSVRPVRWAMWRAVYFDDGRTAGWLWLKSGAPRFPEADRPIAAWRAW